MKVAFHTLGCKVNQYETEAVKEAFTARGALIVPEDESADIYIVNTCTVTNIADRKSRQYIRRMKALNPSAIVLVTGCYAQTSPEEVAEMPEVDAVIGNSLKSEICEKAMAIYNERHEAVTEQVADETAPETAEETATEAANGGTEPANDTAVTSYVHVLERDKMNFYEDMGLVVSNESGLTRAYIKIQEGCDRFCSYCEIPFARGPVRSRPIDEIIDEAKLLIGQGYKELVLTGINTALYGTEQGSDTSLEAVLERLDALDGDFRVRLSSLEPTVVDKEHVERIIRFRRLCHHLHLSVQSGSTKILKRMNRHYTQDEYLDIVKAIRDYDPFYGITTDIIVGFSGEDEEDFQESLHVVKEAEFGRVHAFRYSPRKGTVGAKLDGAVSGRVKAERIDRLIAEADDTAEAFIKKCSARTHKVLTEERVTERKEGRVTEFVTGYTDNYIKVYIEDADGRIPCGEFCEVRLGEIFKDGCLASIVDTAGSAEKGVKNE